LFIQFLFFCSSFKSWDAYFRNNSYASPPSLAPPPKNHVPISQFAGAGSALAPAGYAGPPMAGYQVDDKLVDDHLAVQAIIRSYQVTKVVKVM
jgi:2-oxoglutarate dehydrogenase E1 component